MNCKKGFVFGNTKGTPTRCISHLKKTWPNTDIYLQAAQTHMHRKKLLNFQKKIG